MGFIAFTFLADRFVKKSSISEITGRVCSEGTILSGKITE